MKTYKISYHTSREAEKKAKTLWEKDYGDSGRHWINQTIVN